MVWRGVGIRLADDAPDSIIIAVAGPEIGLVTTADEVSDFDGINISKVYMKLQL
jgi:hypothetical protein